MSRSCYTWGNWMLAFLILFSTSMFLLEKRMNTIAGRYKVVCKVVEKTTAGTRTKRVKINYAGKDFQIDSDSLFYETNIGENVQLLYFSPFSIFMIPGEVRYFHFFLFSLAFSFLLKLLMFFGKK